MTFFYQNNMNLPYITIHQQRGKINSLSVPKFLVNNHLFILEWNHRHCARKSHEEHNATYCDLPNTFHLDEFYLQKSFIAQHGPLIHEVKGLNSYGAA